MFINLTKKDQNTLKEVDISINLNNDYSDDELIALSELIYDQEAFNYDNQLGKELAILGDKIQNLTIPDKK